MPKKYVRKTSHPTVGAPLKEIDFEQFDRLAQIQCTLTEIAAFFKVSEDTIEARVKETKGVNFSEYYKHASAGGKSSLRRAQFKAALGGNTGMLIWLGKQYLGQKDRQEVDVSRVQPLEVTAGDESFILGFKNVEN